jgi:hypothetical protein
MAGVGYIGGVISERHKYKKYNWGRSIDVNCKMFIRIINYNYICVVSTELPTIVL